MKETILNTLKNQFIVLIVLCSIISYTHGPLIAIGITLAVVFLDALLVLLAKKIWQRIGTKNTEKIRNIIKTSRKTTSFRWWI